MKKHENDCTCSSNFLYKLGKSEDDNGQVSDGFIIGLKVKENITEILGLDGFKNEKYAEDCAKKLIEFLEFYKVFPHQQIS